MTFQYKSIQTHSEFNNGIGRTKTNCVSIRGKSGFKSVTIRNKSGRITRKSKKNLTPKEIKCIKNCQFIPGLFRDCEKCIRKLS
jgi:hypothetical protein